MAKKRKEWRTGLKSNNQQGDLKKNDKVMGKVSREGAHE
jgi:hypothetical protein